MLQKNMKLLNNPFIIFSPFLLIYFIFVLILQTNPLFGDERNYLSFAANLIHGYYSPAAPNIDLHDGPGYPIFLMPFVALKLPYIFIKLMNPVLQYLSVVFLFKALKYLTTFRLALAVSLFWACYYNSFDFMPRIYSEIFTSFLVTILVYTLIKAFSDPKSTRINKFIYWSGFIIGYIALTKIIFGYVLYFMLFGGGILWLFNRKKLNYQKGAVILLIAFATTAPYLIYTYQLTGKLFYWGTTGGSNLYWMSTPYEHEYGDWFPNPKLITEPTPWRINTPGSNIGGKLDIKNRNNFLPGTEDSVKLNHKNDFEEINKYTSLKQDDVFRSFAIRNIKSNPVKFARNCISNIGRMLINFPYSYTLQRPATLFRIPLNLAILFFLLICIFPTFVNWRNMVYPIRFLILFSLLYLGGSVLGSAEIRMFSIIVPVLLIWISYILNKSIKFSLKFEKNA